MAKEQLNLRVSDLTRRQLDELGRLWGTTQTETITVIIDRTFREEFPMNIRKPDNIHVDFKSFDWQNAVATMEPKEAVRLLAKEVEALVRQNCEGDTPQAMSRQAELVHNGFIAGAYNLNDMHARNLNLFYRDVAYEMYNFHPIHDEVDYDH